MGRPEKQELLFRRILIGFSAFAGLAFVIQAAASLWVTHGITEVEAIIAAQAALLANGGGLYTDLNQYPFTVSPYGPVLYSLEALGVVLGLAPMTLGRLISMAALVGIVWLVYRLLRMTCESPYAAWSGALLAASTANLVTWGSVGQSDMLGLFFSVAALERYCVYRDSERRGALIVSAFLIAAAIYTKQTFLAAGATISVLYLTADFKRGARYVATLAAGGISVAALLNWATGGGYLSNAVFANLNPFSAAKLSDQLEYFAFTATALCLIAICGLAARKSWAPHPFVMYLAFALPVFLLTAPKVGSDLNYQIETVVALSLCAALALDRLQFFSLLFAGDKGWVTLLQIPLLFHMVLNCAVTGKVALQRVGRDLARQEQYAELAPRLTPGGRLLSVEIDQVLQSGGTLEVEPLIYNLLVDAQMSDPLPVLQDLQAGRFDSVVLYEDLYDAERTALNQEAPSLPAAHLEAIKTHYQLVKHFPGPLMGGLYLYEPKGTTEAGAAPGEQTQANAR